MQSKTTQSFGEWLRRRRERQDLTQWVLAERAGCSFSTICKLETEGRRPSLEMALRLIDVLGVPAEERTAVIELAKARPADADLSAVRPTSASRKARRAASARYGGSLGGDYSGGGENVLASRTPFIGREAETAAVASLLDREEVRLLTLLGPPGTGKTRLGLRVAEQMAAQTAGGVTVVFLGDTTDKEMVLREVAHAFGVVEGASQSLVEGLKAFLREKQTLLVLDNFEQVVGAGYVLGRLLDGCPGLKIMVMSRTALDVYGEHLFAVPGMTLPPVDADLTPEMAGAYEAIVLFEQRSRAVNSTFRLSAENVTVVAEICRRLDGLPLAIELAAARSKILDPGQILLRLGSRLDLLAGGAADLPARQRSLRAAIDWSYELLNEDERRVFCWLSIFPGPVTLDAIEAVCGEGLTALDVVGSLFSKSLVHRIEGEGEVRYYLLGTIREYAHERLVQSGEQHEAVERYALYCDSVIQSERNVLGRLR